MTSYVFEGKQSFIDALQERLEDAGFERIDKIQDAELVLTYCTNITLLEDLYYGEGGLISEVPDGAVVVDFSASTPNLATEINDMLTVHDAHFAAVPVGVKNLCAKDVFKRKNMYCYVAGDDASEDIAEKIADTICSDVRPVDNVALAELSRAFETIQLIAEIVSALEAYELSKAFQSAPSNVAKKPIDIQPTSAGASFVLSAVAEGRLKGNYTVEMLMGEISAALMAADDYGLILPQLESDFHLYELLAIIGGSDLSAAALSVVYDGNDDEEISKLGLDWDRAERLYADAPEAYMEGDLNELANGGFFPEGEGYESFDPEDPFDDQDGFDFSMN